MARALAVLLLVLSTLVAASAQEPARPVPPHERIRADLAGICSQVEASGGAATAYVGTHSSVNFIRGHAWVLSLWVADAPAYRAQYFLLSEVDGRLVGEVLRGAGAENVARLEGPLLARFLLAVRLDCAPLRAIYERFYRRRPGAR